MPDETQSERNKRGVAAGMMRGVRRLLLVVGLLAVTLAALWMFAKQHVHEEIRARVEQMLREHYAAKGLSVAVRSARLVDGQGIELRDVIITEMLPADPQTAIVHIEEVFLRSDVQLYELLNGPPEIQQVTLRRLRIQAARTPAGTWNVQSLFPLPKSGTCHAPVTIENSMVEIIDSAAGTSEGLVLRDIHVTIEAETNAEDPAAVESPVRIRGAMAGNHARRISVNSLIDPREGSWSIDGLAEDVDISPEMRQCLPSDVAGQLESLVALRGRVTLTYHVAGNFVTAQPARFVVSGTLADGRIDDERLPYPLTDLNADIYCDNEGLKVDNMTARSGLGTIELSARRDGFAAQSPLVLKAKAKQLALDHRLAAVLPTDLREAWSKYNPSGTVDMEMTLTYDGHGWKPDLFVECLDVSFAYYQFPYRVRGCIGTIHWQGDVCVVNLRALAAGRVVRFEGEFQNPGRKFTGGLDVILEGPVPLNEDFIGALDDKPRQIVRMFNPRGMVTFSGRFSRKSPQQHEIDQSITIGLRDVAIRYEKFPYPIERITGSLEMTNGDWQFRNLEGHNDSGYIVCHGSWKNEELGGARLEMNFVGTSMPLEDELRQALNDAGRKFWSDIRPQGTIDHLKVGLVFTTADQKLSLDIRAQEWKKSQDLEGRTLTVDPVWLPYRLDDVTGTVQLRDGQLTLTDISATHGKTRIKVDGTCQYAPDAWTVQFSKFSADQLRADDDLLAALPAGLADAVAKLHLSGPVTMQGSLRLAGQPQRPTRAGWDLTIDVEDINVDCGFRLEHIRGDVRLVGEHDGQTFRSRGTLNFDSLMFQNVQLTKVKGPMWIDAERIAFGAWAQPPGAESVGPLNAQVFGGILRGDAQIALSGDAPFDLQGTLTGGNLTDFSREFAPQMRNLAGEAYAAVKLSGNRNGTHTWRGSGVVRLRNATIYEVPAMLATLKLLSIRRPDSTAFTTSNMDFRIHGDHIYLDHIDFNGDAISLKGNGWMSLDSRIDLKFYAMLGRNDFFVPVVTPVLGLASQQFLLIEVNGTLNDPNPPTKTVLPGVNDTLKQLFPEALLREAGGETPQPSREVMRRNPFFPRR